MIKRYGDPAERGVKYTHRPSAYVVIQRGQNVLLTYQAAPFFEYQLPGGGIDPGENPIVALHREVLEETGWRVAGLRRLGAFRRFVYMPDYDMQAEKVCQVYHARPVRPLGPPIEKDHTPVWVGLDVAADMVENPGDAAFLRQIRLCL